jgi:hypothetical protein
LESFRRAQNGLGLKPIWEFEIGRYLLVGVTSTLVCLPVFFHDMLPEERQAWDELRAAHLESIRSVFRRLTPSQRVILFCHDPSALPFLWDEPEVRSRAGQIESTVIGHLHSNLLLWKSRMLAGMPPIRFMGNSVHRMSRALSKGRTWGPFRVKLCPALAGIELLKDGGFLTLTLEDRSASFTSHPLRWETSRQ